MSIIFLALAAMAIAPPFAKAEHKAVPALYALALITLNDDGPQEAAVAHISTKGSVQYVGNFSFSPTAAGMDCVLAFNPLKAVYYGLSGDQPPMVLTLDAQTGRMTASAVLQPAYYVGALGWDNATGLLYGVGSRDGNSVDLISVDPASGACTPITTGLKLEYLRQCEGTLSAKSQRLYVVSDQTLRDDGDEELVTLDVRTGQVLATVPWASSTGQKGALGSFAVAPPAASGRNETLLFLNADDTQTRPMALIQVDPLTGEATTLVSLPMSRVTTVGVLGSIAVTADGTTVYALAFDDGADESLFLTFNLSATPPVVKIDPMTNILKALGGVWGVAVA